MTAAQYIGYTILQTSAISAIVGTRVYHGLRPNSTVVPSINYYERSVATLYGISRAVYSINCRAATAGASRDLAGLVKSLFGGAEGMGTYSTQNNFDVWRAFVVNDLGVIPEPSDNVYNSPIEVQIAYRVEEVS
jgi:hypothetical protein